jgi:psp operon transcriptional activator
VAVLADHFGRRMAAELDWPRWPGFGASAAAMLEVHHWPGNVRELRNVVERAVYRWDDPERPVDAIEFDPFVSPWAPVVQEQRHSRECGNPASPSPAQRQLDSRIHGKDEVEICDDFRAACLAHEKKLLEAALARCRFNQRATAVALKLTYDQLRHALRRHDLLDRAA